MYELAYLVLALPPALLLWQVRAVDAALAEATADREADFIEREAQLSKRIGHFVEREAQLSQLRDRR